MKLTLKNLFKKTPIYFALRTIMLRQGLKAWEQRGRPVPPPHIVKQRTIRAAAEKYGVKVLVETGTYYGDMVQAMRKCFSRIYSIELSKELYETAKRRFAGDDKITIIHGDSGIELGKLVESLDQPALFWLDGHYSAGVTAKGNKDTPIFEELAHIFKRHQRGDVILIDDARCFGSDPAYPSIDALKKFIEANRPNVEVEIKNDSISIAPCS